MTVNISSLLYQTLTYWAPLANTGYGKRGYAAPVTIDGRWEDRQELFIDPAGEEKLSHAKAFANDDVELNGYLYLGTSAAADPTSVDGALEIRQFKKIPSVDADEFLRTIWL